MIFIFRIEPLLVKDYHRIAPLVIQPYNATFHTPYSEIPPEILVPEQQQGGQYQGAGVSAPNFTHKEEFSPGGTPKGLRCFAVVYLDRIVRPQLFSFSYKVFLELG
jgi:hypothetical protein